jgi:hypothetical protein
MYKYSVLTTEKAISNHAPSTKLGDLSK